MLLLIEGRAGESWQHTITVIVFLSPSPPSISKCLSQYSLASLVLKLAGLSLRSSGFDSISVHVRFVVSNVALGQVFSPVLLFFPVIIIPPLLHNHSSIYHPLCSRFSSQYFCSPLSVPFHQCSTLIFIYMLLLPEGRTNGRSLGTFQKVMLLGNRGRLGKKLLPLFFFSFSKG